MRDFDVKIDFDMPDYLSLSIEGEGVDRMDETEIAKALRAGSYQERVGEWLEACFGESKDPKRKTRRAQRFAEESIEFVQSLGIPKSDWLELIDYVYGRPAGEPCQELGGVMVTLMGAASAHGLVANDCAESELARVWTKVESIRAKNARQLPDSVLPGDSEPKTDHIDPRTGRPIGDHGTALQAITYAVDYPRCEEADTFLKGWMEGDLDEWPEYYEWLKTEAANV